jgi:catechol 2,3-dioxygenase-like lactoylglutathione lyase family enzyme
MAIRLKGIDHYAIAVTNLERSLSFYHNILGLSILTRPNFDFQGAWLDCGNGISLHLIVQPEVKVVISGSRDLHFAFAVDNLASTKDILIKSGVDIIKDIKPRPDGVLQLFIKDPDGYFIELTSTMTK